MSLTHKCFVSTGVAALVLVGCAQANQGVAPPAADMPAPELPAPPPTNQPAPPSGSAKPDPGAASPLPQPVANACGSDRIASFVNQLPTADTMAKLQVAVGHNRIRVIRPGDAVTQDYREDRLNVEIGDDGRIKTLRCG